jgi:UDP-N-acetylglucosamine:LPS N-acetylglucosamine transferase
VPETTKITEVRPEGKLRVLILHDSARIGGAEGSLVQLARNLDRSRFEVIVVCPKEGPLVQKLRKDSIHVIPLELSYFSLKTRSSYIRYFQSLFRLWRLVNKLRIDIVHCNSCRAAHWGVPLSWLLSVRTICHVRDSRFTRATQFFLKHAPATVNLVAVSAAIKSAVQSVGVRETRI